MKNSKLRIDNRARTSGGRCDVEALIVDHPRDFLCFGVVGEKCPRAFAVGQEIDGLACPHRIAIIRILPRHLDDARIREIGDPYRCCLAAAVALPVRLPLKNGNIGNVGAVGRIGPVLGHIEGQLRGQAAGYRNGEEMVRIVVAGARRAEENALSIRRPADRNVRAGMVREAAWFAARGRHDVNIDVAVVIAAESDHRAIGRENGPRGEIRTGNEALCVPSIAADDPDVTPIHEGDLRFAQRGRLEQ